MKPHEILNVCDQLRRATAIELPEGAAIQIAIPKENWDELLAYVQQYEPVTMWPLRQREHITNLKIHNIEIVWL